MEDGEEEEKAKVEAKEEVGEEASRRIQGLEPPQDDVEKKLKEEKGQMAKDGTPDKQDKDKKDSDVEKVLAGEKESTLEKVLEELEPTKDEKCCGFMGIEPVGGRYQRDTLLSLVKIIL